MTELVGLYEAIVRGDLKMSVAITRQALAENVEPLDLVTKYMAPAMDEVGRRFECREYYVPGLVLGGRAMRAALEILRPILAQRGAPRAGRVVIGTVRGDQHDIGKNLVSAMLEGAGFEVLDLGTDVPADRFIAAVKGNEIDVLALSALLTITMSELGVIIEALKSAGLRNRVKVMVGGAPVTQRYADAIGADGYGQSAAAGVALAQQWQKGSSAE